jgi:hypothetical protein
MAFVYDAIDGNGEVGNHLRNINPDPHYSRIITMAERVWAAEGS